MNDMLDDIPDENLRDKLRQYHEEPEPDLWNRISTELRPDESTVADRLKNYSDEPADFVWTAVHRELRQQRVAEAMFATGQVVATIAFLLLMFPLYLAITEEAQATHNVTTSLATPLDRDSTASNNPRTGLQRIDRSEHTLPPDGKQNTPEAKGISKGKSKGDIARLDERLEPESHVSQSVVEEPGIFNNGDHLSIDASGPDAIVTTQTIVLAKDDSSSTQLSHDNHIASSEPISRETLKADTILKAKTDTVEVLEAVNAGEQNNDDSEKSLRKARIYLLAMPTFGFQEVKPVTNDDIFIQSIDKVSAFSTRRLGVRVEAGLEKQLTGRISVSVGMLYFQRKQTISYQYTDSENFEVTLASDDSLIFNVEQPVMSSVFEYQLKNLGLSAGLNYSLKRNRFGHKIGLAAEIHKPLASTNAESPTDAKLYLFGNAYYRFSYRLSERFDALFQPTFNYALQVDQRVNAPFYVKPYGIGLNFGLYYYLR
jgi:hypothetical protein